MNTIDIRNTAQAAQAVARTIKTSDGSLIIPIMDGLFDIFQGSGFKHQSRFRIIKLRGQKPGTFIRQLIQVNGLNLTQEQRHALLELVH